MVLASGFTRMVRQLITLTFGMSVRRSGEHGASGALARAHVMAEKLHEQDNASTKANALILIEILNTVLKELVLSFPFVFYKSTFGNKSSGYKQPRHPK